MAALRRMAIPQDNRHLLVEAGILAMLARAGRSGEVEIQREVIFPDRKRDAFVIRELHILRRMCFSVEQVGVVLRKKVATANRRRRGLWHCATCVDEKSRHTSLPSIRDLTSLYSCPESATGIRAQLLIINVQPPFVTVPGATNRWRHVCVICRSVSKTE